MLELSKTDAAIAAIRRVDSADRAAWHRRQYVGGKSQRREFDSLGDPAESAKAAGLRYVTDTVPGIARRLTGKRFSYFEADGKRIGQVNVLERIRILAIPPA